MPLASQEKLIHIPSVVAEVNLPPIERVKWATTAVLRENQTLTFTSEWCQVTVGYAHYDKESVIVISFAGNKNHPKPSAVSMTSRRHTSEKLNFFYNTLCNTQNRNALDLDYFLEIVKMYFNS